MSDTKKVLADLERQLKVSTDDLRPSLQLAVNTIGDAMKKVPGGGAIPDMLGPDLWTWVDQRGKVYAVAPSPEKDGHPMLTIRQPLTTPLGVWLTTTALILGLDRTSILNSVTVTLVAHTGAYAGYQSTITAIAVEGNPMDGMNRACQILDRDPTVNSVIAGALRDADKDKDSGGMN